jgi:hypothetical protein
MKQRWSKLVVVLAALALTLGFGTGLASAGPHFDGSEELTISGTGALTATFREVGLGNVDVTYTLSANAEITCQCVGKSGNCPSAANKATFSAAVAGSVTLHAENGHVDGSITVQPPSCPTGSGAQPTCGKGQHFVTSGVSYSNISLADSSNQVFADIATTAGPVTFFTCN